jgi:hypothetical protein
MGEFALRSRGLRAFVSAARELAGLDPTPCGAARESARRGKQDRNGPRHLQWWDPRPSFCRSFCGIGFTDLLRCSETGRVSKPGEPCCWLSKTFTVPIQPVYLPNTLPRGSSISNPIHSARRPGVSPRPALPGSVASCLPTHFLISNPKSSATTSHRAAQTDPRGGRGHEGRLRVRWRDEARAGKCPASSGYPPSAASVYTKNTHICARRGKSPRGSVPLKTTSAPRFAAYLWEAHMQYRRLNQRPRTIIITNRETDRAPLLHECDDRSDAIAPVRCVCCTLFVDRPGLALVGTSQPLTTGAVLPLYCRTARRTLP